MLRLLRWIAQRFKMLLRYVFPGFMGAKFQYRCPAATDYTSSGTDIKLTSPDHPYDSTGQFYPMTPVGGASKLYIGDYAWYHSASFPTTLYGQVAETGTTYGQIRFWSGNNWNTFAGAGDNGLKTIELPQLANDDDLGGTFDFYYHNTYWTTAFNGNSSDAIVVQTGTVYKGSISDANLVVRWDGTAGNAGGGSMITDTVRYII